MSVLATVVSPTMGQSGEVNLQPVGDVTTWPDTPYRWMDIADFLYSFRYQSFFNYEQPTVKLSFCDISSTFEGTLVASELKPNFAYQVKLVGKPTKVWGAGGDDWANEQIGYAGRWWRSHPTRAMLTMRTTKLTRTIRATFTKGICYSISLSPTSRVAPM